MTAAQRDGLAVAIQDERTRTDARDQVAALAHGMADVAGDLDGLLARAGDAAGNDPAKADAYRAAALGLWHGARQARDAAEDAAWTGVLPHLTGGAVTAWTDLPADVWRALSPRQQAAVRERTENPYGGSDPEVLAELKDMVAKDPAGFKAMDLGQLYGVLAPEDAAEWRALQEGARSGEEVWGRSQAQLAMVSRAVDFVNRDRSGRRSPFYQAIEQASARQAAPLTWNEMLAACQPVSSTSPGLFQREAEADAVRKSVVAALPQNASADDPFAPPLSPEDMLSPGWRRPDENPNLGALSKEKESGGAGPGLITRAKGDPGQASYGIYQFSTRYGVAKDFALSAEAAPWRNLFGRAPAPGTTAFDVAWESAAAADPSGFASAQHQFYKRSAFDPFLTTLNLATSKKLSVGTTLDFRKSSYVLQDVLWSTRVHHGNDGAINVVENAMRDADFIRRVEVYSHGPWSNDERERLKFDAERDLIAAVYAERGRTDANGGLVYFKAAGARFSKGLKLRFIDEARSALAAQSEEARLR